MKGKIVEYNDMDGNGTIYSSDGDSYEFTYFHWNEEQVPEKGLEVDFDISGDNAINIYISKKDFLNKVSDNLSIWGKKTTQKSTELGEDLKEKGKSVKDFSLTDKVKSFSIKAVETVEELDLELARTNSSYEINDFRVSSTAGMAAGMTLDIHFVKNQGAKDVSSKRSQFLMVENEKTGSIIQVPKTSLINKESAKIKDPKTGEILTINAKTGEIII